MADSAEDIVLAFVNEQNRPVNAQNVADALQKYNIKKTAVQKHLDSLVERGKIAFKDYGKQRIFVARQDLLDIPSAAALDEMRRSNEQLQAQAMGLREQCASLDQGRTALESSLTAEQLDARVKELNAQNTELAKRLHALKEGAGGVSVEDRKQVEESYAKYVDLWRKRKRMFNDLWSTVTENFPRNKLASFKEELGVEMDEDVGCSLADHAEGVGKRKQPPLANGTSRKRQSAAVAKKKR